MAKRKNNKNEPDSVFLRKIILYFILGTIWVRVQSATGVVPLPLGLGLGLYFAHHEHFQIDRKIEYATLLLAALFSYIQPIGFILLV